MVPFPGSIYSTANGEIFMPSIAKTLQNKKFLLFSAKTLQSQKFMSTKGLVISRLFHSPAYFFSKYVFIILKLVVYGFNKGIFPNHTVHHDIPIP